MRSEHSSMPIDARASASPVPCRQSGAPQLLNEKLDCVMVGRATDMSSACNASALRAERGTAETQRET